MTFEVLRDLGNRVAEQYGLVFTLPEDLQAIYAKFGIDLPTGNGDGTWRLPIPARFVIDRDGHHPRRGRRPRLHAAPRARADGGGPASAWQDDEETR